MKEREHYCRNCRKIHEDSTGGKWYVLSDGRKYWRCQKHKEERERKE